MADVSKIKLPDNTVLNLKDGRMGNAKIFHGTCSSEGSATAKVVACADFTSANLVKGALIFVTFDATNSGAVASLTMNVNSTGAKSIKKQGNASSTNNLANAGELRANSTYLFQYDGTNWVCMTLDYNSTYSALSEADMEAGTATTGRIITAAILKQAIEYWTTGLAPYIIEATFSNVNLSYGSTTSGTITSGTFAEAVAAYEAGRQVILMASVATNVEEYDLLLTEASIWSMDGSIVEFGFKDPSQENAYIYFFIEDGTISIEYNFDFPYWHNKLDSASVNINNDRYRFGYCSGLRNETLTDSGVWYVLPETPTLPNVTTKVLATTDQIPDVSTLLPKSGGTMSSGATIAVPNTSAGSTTTVAPGYVYIDKGDFTIQIDATTLVPRVTVQDDDNSTLVRLQPTELIYGDGTDTYTQSFPSKSGTFAMTSDIPSVPVTDVTVGGSSVVSNGTAVIPAIPSAPGTLDTTATTSQTTSASESLSGSVTLHKVSKTGSYWDLTYKPWQRGGNNDESLYWGYECAVAGSRSLAEGYKCETGGSYTSNTKSASQSNVNGSFSHAEGNATIAKGLSCHSEGKKTFASGEGSHAEGIETEAKGIASHSEGEYTQANNKGEHAEGRYNKSTQTSSTYGNAGNTTHSIGIGTGTSDRKNAVEVMENGDVYVKGIGSYDGTNYSAASSLQTVISNVPSASNFVQKSGDTMSANATLTFTDSTGDYTTIIAPRQTSINDSDNGYSVLMTVNSDPILSIDNGSENSMYKTDSIVYDDGSNSYTLSYPSASGTLALTSQIPSAVTESTVAGWGFTKNTGTYSKPSTGIPASDIASGVIPTVPSNVSAFTNDANYVKYALCADEAAYSAIANKDSGTLYLIPEEE